jgi:PKD repeat protein
MMTLQFHKIPSVDLTIDQTVCYGYNLQSTYVGDATVPVSRFTWIFGGDTISNKLGQNIEQIPLGVNQTKRDLVLKVTEDGCTGSNFRSDILVIPDLKLFVKDSLQCQPVPFEFSATNTENVVRYEWDWGDGSKGTGKNATHLYARDGFYDVNLVVTTDKGCTNSVTIEKMVYVAPIPTVGFSISPATCLNPGKNTLNYVGSATDKDTFYWDLKGFDPVEIVQSPDTASGPFVFDLINKPKTTLSLYVISQYGCRSTTSSLEVKRKPIFSFTSSTRDGCVPVPINFNAKPDDPVDQLSFRWEYGDGDTGAGAGVSHSYLVPNMEHDVRLSAVSSVTGCEDSLLNAKYIVVHPNPTAGFTMDHDIVYNDMPKVVFQDQSAGAVNYYWNFGDGTHSREKDPEHSYSVVGRRKVLQTVYNQFDCQDTTSKVVLIAFSRIFAPNAFSPNAPAEIDREFKLSSEGIKKEGYHLVILSRWNDIVFECRNEVKGWDGRMGNGNFAPAGNYVWILECNDFLDRPHRQTGSLTLIF